jgi:hypothetical protein
MSRIITTEMKNNNISRIFAERNFFDLDPEYQRNSDIWDLAKKQLFIDSIINEYDIPKLYFHLFSPKLHKQKKYEYAIIDGKQRLNTIWEFINGSFPLADDFVYFADESINLKGLTYKELGEKYPRIKNRFDSTNLPIIEIITDDEDLIEDMFSRLNEAVPLNSAESRNAIGGSMAKTIREVADCPFFKNKVKFSNKRYQHREVAARLLFLEFYLQTQNKIYDTKKIFLDQFVRNFKLNINLGPEPYKAKVTRILKLMDEIFINKDPLLKSQSIIPIYYLIIRELDDFGNMNYLNRKKLSVFNDKVKQNKKIAEEDITKADYELLEYNKLTIQGTNDASSIKDRVRILKDFIFLTGTESIL